jgi:hypothetical protein
MEQSVSLNEHPAGRSHRTIRRTSSFSATKGDVDVPVVDYVNLSFRSLKAGEYLEPTAGCECRKCGPLPHFARASGDAGVDVNFGGDNSE